MRYGMSSKWVDFFIDKGEKIQIKGSIHQAGIEYTITGSDINRYYSNFLNKTRVFEQKTIQMDIERKNMIIVSADEKLINEKLKLQKEQYHSVVLSKIDYIKSNPDQLLSTYLLSRLESDTIRKYANLIRPEARKTKYWDRIEQEITFKKIIVIGNLSPELNEKDISGIRIDLKDYKGKYIVLDFWGSWCAPCKRGLPQMKEYYEKYKEKFEFISIACNDKESDLEKIIDDYELKWTQILNNADNDLSAKFEIEAYPTKIILDPNGSIIGIFKGENPAFYQKIDDLMSATELKTIANK
jgi:thiol-disulfide isomerase/thioredoxin